MITMAIFFSLSALLVLASVGLFIKDINPVELNEMGVEIEAR